MTAVASPPSLQPLQRIGWNNEDVQDDAAGISQDGASRIVLTRKVLQRSNSSSSISSDSSANTTISTNPSTGTTGTEATSASLAGVGRGGRPQVADREAWSGSKKPKSLWPAYRGEGAFGGNSSGSGAVRQFNFSSGGGSGLNGSHPSSVSIAENMQNVQQAGGGRVLPHTGGSEPQALLILVPTNGTFERKSISVPLFPEILRIGRQTNAKTIPTPTNGFFDSKVLSRQHAEVWADRNGKIWIRDVKSSNGTFVNGQRLSPESRDSEPHELQENFSLELGIDIVSEDQKSIVHHKVSAKVEHAGFPNSSANVMDLTFGDLDPGASNGLLNSMPNGLNPRPRLGSQSSIGSNGSRFDGQAGARSSGLGVQRHMNSFLSPVSIETVMRKLNAELKQARQQSQDISRTNEFFKALLATEPGQEPPKAPASILPPKPQSSAPPHTNGLMPTSKLEHLSPFSAPPAPPPQLPLPEKPDAPKSAHVDMSPAPFKRSSTDSSHPNGKADNSSQILSLVETLHSTRKELDVQSNRIKELEELLKHERKAREMAEERARMLSSRHRSPSDPEHVTPVTPPEDEMSVPLVNGTKEGDDMSDTASEADTVIIERPIEDLVGHVSKGVDAELAVSALQEKLNKMVKDMEEAKKQLDQQRERAVSAETERDNLVDMVQRIRQAETTAKKPSRGSKSIGEIEKDSHGTLKDTADQIEVSRAEEDSDIEEIVREADALITMNGKPPGPGMEAAKDKQIRELQESLAKALARAKRTDQLVGQSTPYVSMLGVVILGVSAMLYLNSFQKSEK